MSHMIENNDDVLQYTKEKRILIVDALTKHGIPDDPKALNSVLAALDGLDRQAIGIKRIEAESNLYSKSAIVGAAITELLTNLRKVEPPTIEVLEVVDNSKLNIPKEYSDITIVEGELSNDSSEVTYDSIVEEEVG